jgi:voltage-gated potassium channel
MSPREPNYPYQLFMLVLSIYALGLLGADALFRLDPEIQRVIQFSDLIVCVLFFADFLRSLYRAPMRWRYMYTWGWLDLLSSIPMIDAFRVGRLARVLRVLRILRGIRATKLVAAFLLERRAQSVLLVALLVSLLVMIFASVSILHFEDGAEANIKNAEDALWWAFVTMTTVGYGDKFPLSSEGRMVAALLMTAGVGLFGTLSGLIAGWFLSPAKEEKASELESLRAELRELRDLVLQLRR